MKRQITGWVLALAGGLLLSACARGEGTGGQAPRPKITGISHLAVYVSDAKAAEHFYVDVLGASKGPDLEDVRGVRYYFRLGPPAQFVEVLPLPADHGISRMDHVAFSTSDARGLHAYLQGHATPGLTDLKRGSDGALSFEARDPEANLVQFVEAAKGICADNCQGSPSSRIIHLGFLVHDRAREDRFYKDLLGFKPYWYGAMQADKVDWVSQQVPDGHDWLEYMLVGDGSTTPLAHIDQRELGVLNHLSLGVDNMEAAMTTLISQDRLSPRHDGPQMGKDGKWQANFYDPDGTRVEFMEFQPVMKPCCSPFTSDSPKH